MPEKKSERRRASETPMMRQYARFKAQHRDAILLFRMGDFYEMFFEDAEICARVLGLTLTSRSKGEDAVPMAGFPHHAAETYIRKLISGGYRVAICDQVQDPKEAKGLVDRDVTRIITPGTLTEDSLLEAKAHNFLAAVCLSDNTAGLSWVDLSTGEFFIEDVERKSLLDELLRISPSECLVPEALAGSDELKQLQRAYDIEMAITSRPDWTFGRDTALRALLEHFGTSSLDGFGCSDADVSISAAGAIINYLRETQRTSLSHITRIRKFVRTDYMLVDRSTRHSLELFRTMRTDSAEGTLLWVLDETLTGMGGRLLREWLRCPLKDVERIRRRLDAVSALFNDSHTRERIRRALKGIFDIERIVAKVSTRRASPRDLLSLRQSLLGLPALKKIISPVAKKCPPLAQLRDRIDEVEEVCGIIGAAIAPDAPPTLRDGGVIRDGYDRELDELRSIARGGKEWIARFQAREIERTGIPSLKVGFNKVFGYYIEVTNVHRDSIPQNYIRKQTLKNAERYITPELKEYESRVLTADERAKELEYSLFTSVRDEVAKYVERLQNTARAIANLDVLASLAEVAAKYDYTKPQVDDSDIIEIRDGRHPVLERTHLDEPFVPNDTYLDCGEHQIAVITGPNMAGKSTYIRQVALIVLMAQIGSFVPARKARIGVVDRIFTRVGAADEIARGQSTFMVEMNETANILNNATERSLLILDEVGRGTSTFDGVSIAWAVTEYICKRLKSRTLFATHYHELTELALLFPNVKNYNIAVKEWQGEVVFLRKIVEGGTDKSYGLHVARLAGIPEEVIQRASVILSNLEADSLDMDDKPRFARETPEVRKPKKGQLMLFAELEAPKSEPESEVLNELKRIDPSTLTPIEALNKLNELTQKLRKAKGQKRKGV